MRFSRSVRTPCLALLALRLLFLVQVQRQHLHHPSLIIFLVRLMEGRTPHYLASCLSASRTTAQSSVSLTNYNCYRYRLNLHCSGPNIYCNQILLLIRSVRVCVHTYINTLKILLLTGPSSIIVSASASLLVINAMGAAEGGQNKE